MRIVRPALALLAMISLLNGLLWLLASERGLQALARLAETTSRGQLQIEGARGRLLGPLDLTRIRWRGESETLTLEALHLDWSPDELLRGRIVVSRLLAGRLRHDRTGPTPPPVQPSDLRLPLAISIGHLGIDRLESGDAVTLTDLSGTLDADAEAYRLTAFRARRGPIEASGTAHLATMPPFALDARLDIASTAPPHPIRLDLQARGPLHDLALAIEARDGIEGHAELQLTPFAAAPLARAAIELRHIDPALWHPGAPTARLNLTADLSPAGGGIQGRFRLHNQRPAALNQNGLPLSRLSGHLDWQGNALHLGELSADFPGGGVLSGNGRWQDGSLALDLAAHQLDAARLVSSLRPTRLAGPLAARLGPAQQTLSIDLQDSTFALQAEATRTGGHLQLPRLRLSAGNAALALHGTLQLDGPQAFTAEGELTHFDPSRFAQVPAARINARLKAEGRLHPRPTLEGLFVLQDSQLARQPLTGQGRLHIDWPRVPLADLAFRFGPNQLTAHGAFGMPDAELRLDLNAPHLAPYGLDGGLNGQLVLGGSLDAPRLRGQLQAATLGLTDGTRLTGLSLNGEAGASPDAPLRLTLALARLDSAATPGLLRRLRIEVDGSNPQHRLRMEGELAGPHAFSAQAHGGFNGPLAARHWQGELDRAELVAGQGQRSARLLAPTRLDIAADAWRLAPTSLGGAPNDWRATLQASAGRQGLDVRLSAHGPRVGTIEGDFQAGLHSAWSLDPAAPWRGRVALAIADLGWLGELIGDGWQSGGQLNGELSLAGSPAHPLGSGRLRGEQLALRLPEYGLDLGQGRLDAALQDNHLRVNALSFESALRPVPRPLRLEAGPEMVRLTAQPGRLDLRGEMRLDGRPGAEPAYLDLHLDRLGAVQLPEQWVLLSGDGRLSWADGALGARGRLAVDAGYWQLAPSSAPRLSDDVVVKRRSTETSAPRLRPRLDLDLMAVLGERVLFSGAGLHARLGGELRLRANGRDLPRASGTIETREGRFDAYGQRLALERGILSFNGLLDNPGLDVRAVRKGLSVEPGVQISGNVRQPIVRLISDPELPETEKLSWLVLGHGPEQMGAGDAGVLLQAASGLLGNDSSGLLDQLKRRFGVDEFGLRSGQLGDTGSRSQSSRVAGRSIDTTASTGNQILSIGKRLSSNALLSYEQALGRADSIVKLTVQLNRQLSLIGRAGSDNALDLFYSLTFGSAPRDVR